MSEAGTNPLASATDIYVCFNGRAVVDKISITLQHGKIVTLIGPNGAGKTTLLRVILGLQAPDQGKVWRRPGLRIGYMPQKMHIDPVLPLTARRFLVLGNRAGQAAVEQVLAEVAISHIVDVPLQALSGGEMQRLLLARALLRAPELLVLDEPVQSVDVTGQRELYQLIGAIRDQRGCGILMVSHDLHLVMEAADQVLCVNGHLCCAGHPEAVSCDPAYLALFPAASLDGLALYNHHHDHIHTPEGHIEQLGESDHA